MLTGCNTSASTINSYLSIVYAVSVWIRVEVFLLHILKHPAVLCFSDGSITNILHQQWYTVKYCSATVGSGLLTGVIFQVA